jgi:hypothetical protein
MKDIDYTDKEAFLIKVFKVILNFLLFLVMLK